MTLIANSVLAAVCLPENFDGNIVVFEVILSTHAAAFFQAADAPLQRKLDRAFDQLRTNPRRHNNIKRLTGKFAGRFLRISSG